jgi:hypothetical protein
LSIERDEPAFRPRGMPWPARIAYAAALLIIALMVVAGVVWLLI